MIKGEEEVQSRQNWEYSWEAWGERKGLTLCLVFRWHGCRPCWGCSFRLHGRWNPAVQGRPVVVRASQLLKETGETMVCILPHYKVKLNQVNHQITFFSLEQVKCNTSVRELLCVMIIFITYMKSWILHISFKIREEGKLKPDIWKDASYFKAAFSSVYLGTLVLGCAVFLESCHCWPANNLKPVKKACL